MSDFSSEYSEMSELSSDDEEFEEILEERMRPKNENFLEETVPQLNNVEFMEHFRVSTEVVNDIAERFSESEYFKYQSGPHGKLSAYKHTCIFLWFAGHQTASFRDVADRFHICISALHKVLEKMIYFLSNLAPEIIKWATEEGKMQIKQHFQQKNVFPGIIGVIDGTHIKIDKPEDDPLSYINRKGYYSLQTQLVCDHQLRITDIYTGYPGSVHDARVFRNSPLCNTLPQKCGDDHILGDSAYPLLPNLLIPFQDRGQLTERQRNYNSKLSANRIVIEHCNGLLKQKWRQLYHVKLRSIRKIVHFIRACCVLHNLSINDAFNLNDVDEDDQPNIFVNMPEEGNDQENRDGLRKRNHIVTILR